MEKYQFEFFIKIGLFLMLIALAFVSATKIKKEKYRLVGNREYIYNSAGLREQKVSYDANNNLEKKVLYSTMTMGIKSERKSIWLMIV